MIDKGNCSTCERPGAVEKIRVRILEQDGEAFDPPAEYFFCCIHCRNVFINANKPTCKLDRDYGNTLARIGAMV